MTQGTNNGGGPRWATMDRARCPLCGLLKPVGVTQVERNGGRCNNTRKCAERRRRMLLKQQAQEVTS